MNNSHKQYVGIFFAACTVILSACAQLLMKYGMLDLASVTNLHISDISITSLFQPELLSVMLWVFTGLVCYAFSMLAWMAALARYELSLAYPILSLSYILVYISAACLPVFHEPLSGLRTIGTVLIMAGVILVTRSGNQAKTSHQ